MAMRRKLCCACGCRGWDTYSAIWPFLRWSLASLASGKYPESRHDGATWRPTDDVRASLAGQPFEKRAALLFIKGNWAEYSTTLGLPMWHHGLRPCLFCNTPPSRLYETGGIMPLSLPWQENGARDYFEECARCETTVIATQSLHAKLVVALAYEKRKHGGRGLCLSSEVPEASLQTGDRLVPGPGLEDVGLFEKLDTFLVAVKFWRPSVESLARSRCHVLDEEIGIGPETHRTVDILHCLHLGVFLTFCMFCLWSMITAGAFGPRTSQDDMFHTTVLVIRHELRCFYTARRKAHPNENLKLITSFKYSTLGDVNGKKLKTKWAETRGLLALLMEACHARLSCLGDLGARLLEAGRALIRMMRVWDLAGVTLSVGEFQASFDGWNEFLAATDGLEELQMSKRHMVAHLLRKTAFLGNPPKYANWRDEGLNCLLKLACRGLAQGTFESAILLRFGELLV